MKFKQNRRSIQQFLVEPFKQVKLSLYFLALTLVSYIVIGFAIWRSAVAQYDQLMAIFQVVGDQQWQVLMNDVFVNNLIVMGGVFVLLSAASIGLSIWLTHRVYGPQVALQRFAREIANGNFAARVRLRQRDEFHKLADELNLMASRLEDQQREKSDGNSNNYRKAS
jgi:nitrate/nitrite-specific signal transduction histidine kinase